MIICETIEQLRGELRQRRRTASAVIGLVPTMGALHDGHLSLIRAAAEACDVVVVSIFVNPTQFGAGEDFQRYPRPLEDDVSACARAGVAVVFTPSTATMYPEPCLTSVRVAGISDGLCGRQRPGHFEGVALVVAKLLNIVAPDKAYFGRKDAQQLAVIRRMVADLDIPVDIISCPIVREPDGLAMSTRNAYLDLAQRQQATALYRALQAMRDAVFAGQTDAAAVIQQARRIIEVGGPCAIDYVELVDPETIQPVHHIDGDVLAAVAVRIGQCRLIDNLMIPYTARN